MTHAKEYMMLREEILSVIQEQNQLSTFTCSSVCAFIGVVLALEIQNPFLYLIPFIILIPASYKELDYKESIARIASYLIVFLESPEEILWETRLQQFFLYSNRMLNVSNNKNFKLKRLLESLEFVALALVCYILFLGNFLYINIKIYHLEILKWDSTGLFIIFALGIPVLIKNIFCCTYNYRNFRIEIEQYIQKWKQYKSSL